MRGRQKRTATSGSAGRTAQQKGDIARAQENVESLQQRLADLEREFEEEVEREEDAHDIERLDFEEIKVRPRKGDMSVKRVTLAWVPYLIGAEGMAEPIHT